MKTSSEAKTVQEVDDQVKEVVNIEDKKLTLRQWISAWDAGKFLATDCQTQIDAGWFDWFCKDESLARRLKRMAPKVKKIARSKKIDIDKMYVWFKNNCPFDGKLYDDFRIADIETGDTVYCITPHSGHKVDEGRSDVWGKENNFNSALVEGTWKDVLKFFEV